VQKLHELIEAQVRLVITIPSLPSDFFSLRIKVEKLISENATGKAVLPGMCKRRTAIIAMTLAGSSPNDLLQLPSQFVQNTPREMDALQKEGWAMNVVHHLNPPSHYICNTHLTGRWNEYEDALENLQDNGILDPRRALAVELDQCHGANHRRHLL